MTIVDSHPHNFCRHRLPPPPPILPAPPPLPHPLRRHTQTRRHQRHRSTQHAAKSHIQHPHHQRRSKTQLHPILRRHLFRDPLDPYLQRNGVLLRVQLLRVQLQTIHVRIIDFITKLGYRIAAFQTLGALPRRFPWHQSLYSGLESTGHS